MKGVDPSLVNAHLDKIPVRTLRNIATLLCLIGVIGIVIGGATKGGFFYKNFCNEGLLHAVKTPHFYAPIGGSIFLSIAAGICRHYAFRKINVAEAKVLNPEQGLAIEGQKVRSIIEMVGLGSLFAPVDIFVTGVRIYGHSKLVDKN